MPPRRQMVAWAFAGPIGSPSPSSCTSSAAVSRFYPVLALVRRSHHLITFTPPRLLSAAQHCFSPFCGGAAKGLCRLIQWHDGCFSCCTTALSMILRRTEARASDGRNELSRSSGTKHACGDEASPCERGNYYHSFSSTARWLFLRAAR